MTGLVRKATLLTFCGLFVAGAAMAGVPNASTSIVATAIKLVGTGSGADPAGVFTITVRDLTSQPVPNSNVKIDFSTCRHLFIGADQGQPGTSVDCTGHVVSVLTSALGVATFRIVGGSQAVIPVTGSGTTEPVIGCAQIKADNTDLVVHPSSGLKVGTPDLDNSSSGGGVSGADLSLEISDVQYCLSPGGPYYLERADMTHNGVVDGTDLSKQIDNVQYMLNPAHNANDGKTCADVGHSCCSLLP